MDFIEKKESFCLDIKKHHITTKTAMPINKAYNLLKNTYRMKSPGRVLKDLETYRKIKINRIDNAISSIEPIIIEEQATTIEQTNAPTKAKKDKIIQCIREIGKPCTQEEIQKMFTRIYGYPKNMSSLERMIRRMAQDDVIIRISEGVYALKDYKPNDTLNKFVSPIS